MALSVERRAERASWLQLVLTPGLGAVSAQLLLRQFGLPEDVLAASATQLSKTLTAPLVAALRESGQRNAERIEANLVWAQAADHHLVAISDDAYPRELLVLADPPPLLWVTGDVTMLQHRCFAIVGSRNATQAGLNHAESFARSLGDAGWTIVSGLALGIDAAAHRGGLASAAGTIAFVGNGLDRVYPAAHRDLAHQIAANGALVSEFSIGTPPLRDHFPRRNRLIAALAQGTLVVEAARQSGSLITARLAAEVGREVFAIPGSIDSPLTKGCHALIKQGAKLVDSAEDVLSELREFGPLDRRPESQTPAGATSTAAANIPDELKALLQFVGWDPVSIDQLTELTGISVAQLSADLLQLELDGRIERLADGRFQQLMRD
jgi:DNA processing protein